MKLGIDRKVIRVDPGNFQSAGLDLILKIEKRILEEKDLSRFQEVDPEKCLKIGAFIHILM
jgi:hypothetical protein